MMATNKKASDDDLGFVADDDIGFVADTEEAKPPSFKERISKTMTKGPDKASLSALIQSFGNAATLGYLPHLQAASEKVMFPVLNMITGQNVEPEEYVKARDRNIAELETLRKENPNAALAGDILGIGSSVALTGGLGTAARGASLASRLSTAAKTGATFGALQNPGDVAGETGLQLGERAKGAAFGGALGLGGEAALTGASAVSRGLVNKLKGAAERRAFKALGPYQRDVLKLKEGQMESIGRTALDEGLLSGLPSYEKIGRRAADKAELRGKELDQLINELSEKAPIAAGKMEKAITPLGVEVPPAQIGVSRKMIAKEVADELTAPAVGIPGAKSENAKVEKLLSEFLSEGPEKMSVRETEDLKRAIGKRVIWDQLPGTEIKTNQKVLRSLYGKLKKGSEDTAEFIAEKLGGNELERLKNLKSSYGNLSRSAQIAGTREMREFANRMLSPSDYFAGGMGFLYGGEAGLGKAALGASAGLANKALRTYGNTGLAKLFDLGSRGAGPSARLFERLSENPRATSILLQRSLSPWSLMQEREATQ